MRTSSVSSQDSLSRLLVYLKQDSANLVLRLDAIHEACDTAQWDTARVLIDQGLKIHPAQVELLALSGVAYLRDQRYADAEQALSEALAKGLQADGPRYNLALSVFLQMRYADALKLLAAPELMQAVPQALLLRARCQHHLLRPEEAIADCRAHLAAAPGDADTHGLLALLLQENHFYEEAQVHIDAALAQSPRQIDAMLARACVQHDARDLTAAKSSFESLLLAHPECGRGWHGLAMIEMIDLQLDRARQHIELAVRYLPRHIGTWHLLAWVHVLQGNVPSAERAFLQALSIDRNFGETHGGLAVAAALQGKDEEARAGIRRALRLDPNCLSVEYAEMVLLDRQGKPDEVRAAFERFTQRPAPGSDQSIRELVAAHLQGTVVRNDAGTEPRTVH